MKDLESATDYLEAKHTATKPVDIPEWDARAWIGSISLKEQLRLEQVFSDKDSETFFMELLAVALVNSRGERIFKSVEEIRPLADKSAPVIVRLGRVASEFNALTKEAAAEAEKN